MKFHLVTCPGFGSRVREAFPKNMAPHELSGITYAAQELPSDFSAEHNYALGVEIIQNINNGWA